MTVMRSDSCEDLAQAVRDVEDAHAELLEPADELEQNLDLVIGQRRGRLVEHEDARVQRAGLDDLDHLLLGDREPAHRRARAEARLADLLEQRGRLTLHRLAVDDPVLERLAADEDVLGHVAIGEQVELLIDDPDAGGLRLVGMVERDVLAVELDRALVRRVHARQGLHQRRLAGAVLADDRVHLAGLQVEVHAVQDLDADKALAYALHLQERHTILRHRSSRP